MLSPRRESRMIEKSSSCCKSGSSSTIRRDCSTLAAIRVIHIFAPKVIKTDVANFRTLVQKLTGKSKRGGSGSKRRAGDSRALRTTSSMRPMTSFSSSSSSEATFSISNDKTSNQSSSTAAETSSPDSFITSSVAAMMNRYFGFPSSFSPSEKSNQMAPAGISTAFFRSQSCTTASSSSNCSNSSSSSNQSSCPAMVDPLQSLSGYKDSWSSPRASSSSFDFSHNTSTSLHDQSPGAASEQQQCLNQASAYQGASGRYNVSTVNGTALNGLAFNEMDILTGLVSPGPLPELSLPPLHSNYNINLSSCNSSIPTITPEYFLLSNQQQQQPSANCRLSVQSLLRGPVSPFEPF